MSLAARTLIFRYLLSDRRCFFRRSGAVHAPGRRFSPPKKLRMCQAVAISIHEIQVQVRLPLTINMITVPVKRGRLPLAASCGPLAAMRLGLAQCHCATNFLVSEYSSILRCCAAYYCRTTSLYFWQVTVRLPRRRPVPKAAIFPPKNP